MSAIQAIEVSRAAQDAALARVGESELTVQDLVAQVRKVQEVMQAVMKDGEHYGVIPGTKAKPTLLKPGAEKLCLLFRLDPEYELIERERDGDHLTITARCVLYHAPSGQRRGSGLGSCSSREAKYAYRKGERVCPKCGVAAIRKSKDDAKEGWYCWRKIDGCGQTFKRGDSAIESQEVGRVANPDLADTYNTVLKMATKRALVAAVLNVTAASDIFAQDLEDLPQVDEEPRADRTERSNGNGRAPISPHLEGDESFDDADPVGGPFGGFMSRLVSLEAAIRACGSYDTALKIRADLGSKAKQSALLADMQRARETGTVSPSQRVELGKIWQRCDREMAKVEKHMKPDAVDSFTDPPDDFDQSQPDPESDGR